jgi:putative copper resistance protein D
MWLVKSFAAKRIRKLLSIGLPLVFLGLFLGSPARSRQHAMPDMENTPGMNHAVMSSSPAPEDPAVAAKRIADKRESEFNHHLAGFFVVLAGIFIFGQESLVKRWSVLRFAWPMCFLAAGLFLLIFSDTEIWPFGPQTPWYAITHNMEDLQHKLFALILLSLGYVEFERTRGRFKAVWTAWFFPVVGMAGAILLLFHVHGGNMQAPNAMETMEHIQKEHLLFASAGFGIALTNGLAETRSKWKHIYENTWPLLLIVLGVLLMFYTE